MSEHQYYEFLVVGHPLDERQQAEVRALSTRAQVTATGFINEYHWGNFRGDPSKMMEHCYDAHLYVTRWGTHQVRWYAKVRTGARRRHMRGGVCARRDGRARIRCNLGLTP